MTSADSQHAGPLHLTPSLGVLDGMAIAASSTAVTTTIGIGLGAMAAVVGFHLPALFLIAFVPIIGIAVGYTLLNKVETNCGNSYVWVGQSLSPWLGFMAGWSQLLATVVFLMYTTAIAGSSVIQLVGMVAVHSVAGIDLDANSTLQTTILGLFVLAPLTWTAIRGVQVAARLQAWLLGFEFIVLIGFCAYGIVAGDQQFSWSWFNPFEMPSFIVLAQGMVVAVFCYWGFETAFSVSEEVREPRQASRAGIFTLALALGMFLLAATAFQRVIPQDQLVESGSGALELFGSLLTGQPLAALPVIALAMSVITSIQANLIPTARGMFAMSRDRTLGPAWKRLHPRYFTPAAATLCVAIIAAIGALLALVIPKLSDVILAAVNSVGLIVAIGYSLTGLAAAARFRGLITTAPARALWAVGFPLASSAVLLGLGGYLAWTWLRGTDHFEFSPDNGWFLLAIPTLILASGLVMAGVAKWARKSPYFESGRGTDADAFDLIPA